MELKHSFFNGKLRKRVRAEDNNLASQLQQIQEPPHIDECGEWEVGIETAYVSTVFNQILITFVVVVLVLKKHRNDH